MHSCLAFKKWSAPDLDTENMERQAWRQPICRESRGVSFAHNPSTLEVSIASVKEPASLHAFFSDTHVSQRQFRCKVCFTHAAVVRHRGCRLATQRTFLREREGGHRPVPVQQLKNGEGRRSDPRSISEGAHSGKHPLANRKGKRQSRLCTSPPMPGDDEGRTVAVKNEAQGQRWALHSSQPPDSAAQCSLRGALSPARHNTEMRSGTAAAVTGARLTQSG